MANIGYRLGTRATKNSITGIDRVAKNIILNPTLLNSDNRFILLENDMIELGIESDPYPIVNQHSERSAMIQCRHNKIDLLHSYYDPCMDFNYDCVKIQTIHDIIPVIHREWYDADASWDIWAKRFKKSAQCCDCIIADSNNTKKDILDFFSIDEARVQVIYPGIDSKLQISKYSGDISSSKFNIESEYIVSVCTLEPRKNLTRLIQGFDLYKTRHPDSDLKLVLVGRIGWLSGPLFDTYNTCSSRDDIILTGYVSDDELLSLYVNAVAVAYISLYEGFGLPVLEAMSLGKAVIASNNSSIPEVGGDAVEYCNPYEIDSICTSIENIIDSEMYRGNLETKALIQSEKFSFGKAAIDISKLYKNYIL